jgi:D-alanine-D-alanine ligase
LGYLRLNSHRRFVAPHATAQGTMRIGLTYNLKPEIPLEAGEPIDRYEEFDSEETVEAVSQALRRLGHEVERLGWGPPMLDALIRRAASDRLDGVFNFAEGVGGRGRESQVPAMLEMLGIPNTGSDPVALALALDKGLAKIFAAGHGIATAPFKIIGADEALGEVDLRYPLFAKPVAEGSSMGIRNGSICRDRAELSTLVAQLQYDYRQPVLVEEFLPGDEFTVGVLGNGRDAEVIGLMQVMPRDTTVDFVYSLEVKRDYRNQVVYRMTDELLASGALTEAKLAAIRKLALDAHRAFGCRDVSRIDVRCDRHDEPNFIEINPLPGLNPVHSDLVIIARGHGWTFDQLIGRIIHAASQRWDQRAHH